MSSQGELSGMGELSGIAVRLSSCKQKVPGSNPGESGIFLLPNRAYHAPMDYLYQDIVFTCVHNFLWLQSLSSATVTHCWAGLPSRQQRCEIGRGKPQFLALIRGSDLPQQLMLQSVVQNVVGGDTEFRTHGNTRHVCQLLLTLASF